MKTKSGKSHWKCETRYFSPATGKEKIDNDFCFVAFDGKKHMDKIKKNYFAHGIIYEYKNLVNIDEQ